MRGVYMIPGSGNFIVDAEEDAQNEEIKNRNKLDCGCKKHCRCDDRDDE